MITVPDKTSYSTEPTDGKLDKIYKFYIAAENEEGEIFYSGLKQLNIGCTEDVLIDDE